MAKKKSAELQYITKSMLPETRDFITWPANEVNTAFKHLGDTHTLDTLRKALRGRITDEATIPNMLMPANRLESLMHCNDQAQAQETLQDEHVKEWLRVLCAVLFNDDTHMKCYELNMGNVLQDSSKPMILRVLAKTLIETGNANPTFKVFEQRMGTGNDDFKPIAFTYSGLRIGVCPVVKLNPDDFGGVSNDPQGWLSCNDPIEYLRRPENTAYRARLDDYLVYDNNGNGTHSYGVFEQEYRIICDEIRSQLAPANGTKAAFFPQRIQNPGGVNQPISYIHWFTDSILCVSCNQNGDGVLAVPGKDFKCVLPIKRLCINEGGDIRAVCNSASVNVMGDDLIVSFTYNNLLNQRRYTPNMQIHFDVNQNPSGSIGSIMLWPNKVCPEWNRYFSYLSNNCFGLSDNELNPFSMEVYAGTAWHGNQAEFRKMQQIGNKNTQNYVWDCVIETNEFPTAIELKRNNEAVGMLVPTASNLAPVPNGANGQLGVDFGTTNTIAYFHSKQVDPEAVTISDSRKILLQDPVNGSDSNAFLPFLFAPDGGTGSHVPFKTAVQVFQAVEAKAFLNAIAPLQYRADLNDRVRELLNLDDDLKWPNNMAGVTIPTNSAAFLEYVMLLWLWEVRRQYNVLPNHYVFTYPGAMNVGFIRNLTTKVLSHMPGYTARTSVDYATEASVVINFLEDEVVRGKYAAQGYNWIDIHTGYLLMDIGGGSVDVSLWQEKQHQVLLCSELSLENFAGNRIQLEQVYPVGALQPKLHLLAEIMGYSQNELNNVGSTSDAVAFYQFCNKQCRNLKSFRQQWTAHIDTIRMGMEMEEDNAQMPRRYRYRKTLEMYFHFMFFLNGYAYGKALQEGRMSLEKGTFAIMMAGNGSRMYDLCGGNSPEFQRLNLGMFEKGVKYAGYEENLEGVTVTIVPSIMHKHEVAYGASKFQKPPVQARPGGTAFSLATINHAPVAADTNPAWLKDEDAGSIRPKAEEFFRCYLNGLNEVCEQGNDFMRENFGYELDKDNFFNNAQSVIGDTSLPKAAASIFRTLLTQIGNNCFK